MSTVAFNPTERASAPASSATAAHTVRHKIAQREQLTESTGHYWGIEEFTLKDADPIKYERFYASLHSALHGGA